MNTLDAEGFVLDLDLPAEEAHLDAQARRWPKGIPSGTQLRHRLITPETLAAMEAEEPKPTFLQRIFGRK